MDKPVSPAIAAQAKARLPLRAKLDGGLGQGLISATAAILAYLPTKPLGL